MSHLRNVVCSLPSPELLSVCAHLVMAGLKVSRRYDAKKRSANRRTANNRRWRSSPLNRRSVSRSCLDRMHIGRSRKGFECRLAGLAGTADRGKEIVQAGRQIGPSHLKLIRAIIDDLVSDAGCGIDGRARDEWVRHSVDDNGAPSREAEQDLLVGRMRMLAHIPAGRDDLYPHPGTPPALSARGCGWLRRHHPSNDRRRRSEGCRPCGLPTGGNAQAE